MAATLAQLVGRVRGNLDQFTTNRPTLCTFEGFTGSPVTGIALSDMPPGQQITSALVELGHELVFVRSADPTTSSVVCPPWFRQQQGTPANDDYPVNSVAVINPTWPYWHVAQAVIDGISRLYPALFAVNQHTFTATALTERYALPLDVQGVLGVHLRNIGSPAVRKPISRWTFQRTGPDGLPYLHVPSGWVSHDIEVTYRAQPVAPAVPGPAWTWADSGLPDTASDLPVLYATSVLLPSAEAAKTQTKSIEQSDRNRFVGIGSANAASRRFEELFDHRLVTERRAQQAQYPPKLHRALNG